MLDFVPCCKCENLVRVKDHRTDGLVCDSCREESRSMFYIELNNNKTVIVTMPCKAKVSQEMDSVMFLNDQDEIVVFYKLSEIKGFFKDNRTPFKEAVL
ncbi:hypothetical protein ABEP17_18300 [Priestia flexa]|uniref:hypothetical protein n=1 Tax=Priestia flexa TaxID=86664 RepID=UPI003D2A2321